MISVNARQSVTLRVITKIPAPTNRTVWRSYTFIIVNDVLRRFSIVIAEFSLRVLGANSIYERAKKSLKKSRSPSGHLVTDLFVDLHKKSVTQGVICPTLPHVWRSRL